MIHQVDEETGELEFSGTAPSWADLGGGPFAHRFLDGICTVCGYDIPRVSRGCPWNVDMALYTPGKPIGSVKEMRQALALLRSETWKVEEE